MEPVKAKLKRLGEFMPHADEVICGYASYLADHLNPELVPEGFNLAAELAIEDLRRGGDYGAQGRRPVPAHLVGYPPMIYSLMRMQIPQIAEAVCPPEFAKEVTRVVGEVNEMLKKIWLPKIKDS